MSAPPNRATAGGVPPKSTADGAAVASPCMSVCTMSTVALGDLSVCEGCGRTLDEIATWSVMSDADKLAVWDALPARLQALP